MFVPMPEVEISQVVDAVAVRKKLDEMRRRPIEPDPGMIYPQPYPDSEGEALFPEMEPDIVIEKAVPGGLKMWHLLVALGVLFWMKKR